jgi:hypothetical protein
MKNGIKSCTILERRVIVSMLIPIGSAYGLNAQNR